MIAFWTPSPVEIIIILAIALLLFGKRLPEVGRSLGRGIVEFKKGVKGIEDDIENPKAEADRLASSDPHEDDPYRPLEKGGESPAPDDELEAVPQRESEGSESESEGPEKKPEGAPEKE